MSGTRRISLWLPWSRCSFLMLRLYHYLVGLFGSVNRSTKEQKNQTQIRMLYISTQSIYPTRSHPNSPSDRHSIGSRHSLTTLHRPPLSQTRNEGSRLSSTASSTTTTQSNSLRMTNGTEITVQPMERMETSADALEHHVCLGTTCERMDRVDF